MESKEFNVPRASAPSYEEAMKCSSVPPVRMYPTEEPPNYTPKPYPTQNPSQPIFQSLNTVDSTTISVEPASVANANTINIEQSQSAVQNRTKKSGSGYVVFLFLVRNVSIVKAI